MPKLMLKLKNIIAVFALLFFSNSAFAQFEDLTEDVDNFVKDAVFYSDKFIGPSLDAVIYQSAPLWMTTPKKQGFGAVTLGLHGNAFFVPKANRSFTVNQSDFSFFNLPNGQTTVEAPTGLGGEVDYSFTGNLGVLPISISAPEGVNQEQVIYPYLQAGVELWGGLEVMGRYSSKVQLKKGSYQMYGFGIKYNISQHMPFLERNNIALAALLAASYEDLSFDFIETDVELLGDVGVSEIVGEVENWQFQVSGSKAWGKFELMLSSITVLSNTNYYLQGEESTFSQLIPLAEILNTEIAKKDGRRFNSIHEVAGRYTLGDFSIQSGVLLGKFFNINLGVQYQINFKK